MLYSQQLLPLFEEKDKNQLATKIISVNPWGFGVTTSQILEWGGGAP